MAYWTDGQGDSRILYVTPGYHLIALDARTGRPIFSFGTNGVVDLFLELDHPVPEPGETGWNSPPIVVRNVVVVGAALQNSSATREFPTGYVRGYNVRTGERAWIFHTIPRAGEFGNDTWEDDSWRYTGHTGAWAVMSADEEIGYVYVPTESATNDNYGGHRPGNNLFAESLVALDAGTGQRIWHFHLGPVNTKGRFVVYWGYENHRVPISSDRGLLSASARQCEHLQSRSA